MTPSADARPAEPETPGYFRLRPHRCWFCLPRSVSPSSVLSPVPFQRDDETEGQPSCGASHRALSLQGGLSLSPPEGSDVQASSAAHSWGRDTGVDGSQPLGWGLWGLQPPGTVQERGFWETFPQRAATGGSGGSLHLGHSSLPSPEERVGQGALVASQGAAGSARPSSPAQHESHHQELSVT